MVFRPEAANEAGKRRRVTVDAKPASMTEPTFLVERRVFYSIFPSRLRNLVWSF